MAVASLFSPRNVKGIWPEDWLVFLLRVGVLGGIVAIASYALQILLGRRFNPLGINVDVVICDNCGRVKRRDREMRCKCGGKFDDFDNWMWEEEEGEERRDMEP